MQFAHSGSEPEKQPPPHPHFPMTPQRAHPTAPNPRYPMAQRRVRSKHHTCITPQRRARAFPHHCTRALHDAGYASSHHAVPVPIHNTAPVPLHGAVRVSTHGAVPAPHHAAKSHAAHSTAPGPPYPPSALLQSCWKSGNKKVIKIATFLRLAIAVDVQITDRAPKMKQNDRSVPHFHFAGDKKEPLIAKKLQKRQDFCFRKANYRNRSRFRNQTIAKRGQIPQ
mgnify:CR=1 FL=1